MSITAIKVHNKHEISNYEKSIMDFEDKVKSLPNAVTYENNPDVLKIKHSFANGLYIREITIPTGMILTSVVHKVDHPFFVMKGKATIVDNDGYWQVEAPYSGITRAGIKRAAYVSEEMVWITVHATDKTDIAEIEKEMTAPDYETARADQEK